MEDQLKFIHEELGITSTHLNKNKLKLQIQAPLELLKVVDIDFEGKPFILHEEVSAAWMEMKNGAARDGVILQAYSGFRSYLHQKRLIEQQLRNGRNLESILTHIAIPGFSEHHTGRAIDIYADGNPSLEENFEKTAEFSWLTRNANQYGFRMSYPRENNQGIIYEPWHWFFG